MKILVRNSGSSSQKTSLYEIGQSLPAGPLAPLWEGKIEWHDETAEAEVRTVDGVEQKYKVELPSRSEAVQQLLATLWQAKSGPVAVPAEIAAVGHRVVHGGPKYEQPVRLTDEVKAGIAEASAFAPLHNRAELDGMEVIEKLLGPAPQFAVFDTGFHRQMPQAAAVYPGP